MSAPLPESRFRVRLLHPPMELSIRAYTRDEAFRRISQELGVAAHVQDIRKERGTKWSPRVRRHRD